MKSVVSPIGINAFTTVHTAIANNTTAKIIFKGSALILFAIRAPICAPTTIPIANPTTYGHQIPSVTIPTFA